jgi:environmental stress-induced protein Ves
MALVIKYSQYSSVPWVNGKGQTTELVSWERSRTLTSTSIPAWRLSIARLEEPAAFSPIPSVRRHFLPVGTSVTLSVNGTQRYVPDRTVTEFEGDDDVNLLDLDHRPGRAVNLMSRTLPDAAAPALVVGNTNDDVFRTCLLAVALQPAEHIDLFDVLTPDSTAVPTHRLAVAMVSI